MVVAYTGVVAPEAVAAVGRMAEARRAPALLAITSADRLNAAGRRHSARARRGMRAHAAQVERLMAAVPRDAGVVTVCDGHPAALAWLGSVAGHRTRALGVEHFGQTGRMATSTATTASTPPASSPPRPR